MRRTTPGCSPTTPSTGVTTQLTQLAEQVHGVRYPDAFAGCVTRAQPRGPGSTPSTTRPRPTGVDRYADDVPGRQAGRPRPTDDPGWPEGPRSAEAAESSDPTSVSSPAPPTGVWHLFGVVPIRAYALCIVAWCRRRGRHRRTSLARPRRFLRTIVDLAALVAVPFGLVGGRLYHVITDWQLYFGPGRRADRGAVHLERRPGHLGRRRARWRGRLLVAAAGAASFP